MFKFILKRILEAIPTLLVLITISFFMMRFAPGNPFSTERSLPPEVMANIEAKYGLDQPVLAQYFTYLGNLAQGDLGPSFKYRDFTVNELVAQALPVSARIGLFAFAGAVLLGVAAGMTAALRQNSWVDYMVMSGAMLGVVIPSFVLAPLLILVFAIVLGWLPAGGWLWRRYLGPAFVGIITGSVVIETIFGLPGIGQLFVNSALNRDYSMVLGLTILVGALTIAFNAVVDILYALIDPKIRY